MFFAKLPQYLSACLLIFSLSGCVNSQTSADFDRDEALIARASLALAYLEQQDFSKAKENIEKALSHNSQHYLAHLVAAYYYQQLSDVQHAEQSYQAAIRLSHQIKQNSPLPEVLNNYGTFLCQQGKFVQAYTQFEQALTGEKAYLRQGDTLENMVLCAKQANQLEKMAQALARLALLDAERAAKLAKIVK
ncbi:fimbrial protein [Bibersteinia trehalosi Y31]|uniref:Fimbrial protein n=1 Tax=Bibersteinia trehalosi Y31 TaxID=1261658 RepID=A0A179CWR3_BIBTR|nr:tetratricopeptide repeat protein [Bibersteinia trehalosi]OAQ14356.1 fimbrial protein [Bibersteinia trehalosi Y31]